MSLLCALFGHKPKTHSYGRHWGGTRDGIGREHADYSWDCCRCGEEDAIYLRVHIPKEFVKPNAVLTGAGQDTPGNGAPYHRVRLKT